LTLFAISSIVLLLASCALTDEQVQQLAQSIAQTTAAGVQIGLDAAKTKLAETHPEVSTSFPDEAIAAIASAIGLAVAALIRTFWPRKKK